MRSSFDDSRVKTERAPSMENLYAPNESRLYVKSGMIPRYTGYVPRALGSIPFHSIFVGISCCVCSHFSDSLFLIIVLHSKKSSCSDWHFSDSLLSPSVCPAAWIINGWLVRNETTWITWCEPEARNISFRNWTDGYFCTRTYREALYVRPHVRRRDARAARVPPRRAELRNVRAQNRDAQRIELMEAGRVASRRFRQLALSSPSPQSITST